MDERLESWIWMYQNNENILLRNPYAFEIMWENEIIFRKMMDCIPQSHYDEINLLVYGISRL